MKEGSVHGCHCGEGVPGRSEFYMDPTGRPTSTVQNVLLVKTHAGNVKRLLWVEWPVGIKQKPFLRACLWFGVEERSRGR